MEKFKRYVSSAIFGILITAGLLFFMIALITINNEKDKNTNFLTTQIKVSSPPGLTPSRKINSDSKKLNHQLPSKRTIKLPIDHKKLLSDIRSQEADGSETDPLAAPARQQRLLQQGSQSQAKVVLAGQFNVIGPDPQYPHEALIAGKEGWVDTLIHVKQDGTVDDVEIVGAGPAGIFELAVVTAVFDWKIEFAKIKNAQIKDEYFHRFEFKIDD